MTPQILKRAVLDRQVTGPQETAFHIERHDLTVAEPRVYPLSVGHRSGSGEIVLFVQLGKLASGLGTVLPKPVSIRSTEGFHDKKNIPAQ